MTQPLVDLDIVVDQLHLTDQTDFTTLAAYLLVATEVIERQVGPVLPQSYTETVNLSPTIVLSRAPVVSLDALTPVYPEDSAFYNSGYTYNVGDYLLDPAKGIVRRIPRYGYAGNYGGVSYGYGFSGLITVTYTAGRTTVPAAMKQAAILLVKELIETERGSMPLPLLGGGGQDEMPYGPARIPSIVFELLAPYAKAGRVA